MLASRIGKVASPFHFLVVQTLKSSCESSWMLYWNSHVHVVGNCDLNWIGQNQPPVVFYVKIVPCKYFTKFTGKHLFQSLFFNKAAGLRPATLFKKRLCGRDFEEILRAPFYRTPLDDCFSLIKIFCEKIKKCYCFSSCSHKHCVYENYGSVKLVRCLLVPLHELTEV